MQKIRTNLIYPIFIPHAGCQYTCVYCNQYITTSKQQQYGNKNSDFTPKLVNFIQKHKNKMKEIAFYGGSFTCLPSEETSKYFNEITALIDETTWFRISTRPDAISESILSSLKTNRVSTIELGVQTFCNRTLSLSKRGYNSETAETACNLVLDYGFNLSIQFLIGLPGEDMKSIEENITKLIKIKPDYVRLYPLLVIKDTQLEKLYMNGEYKPLSLDSAVNISLLYLQACQQNNIKVIKIGLHSDISKDSIIAGPYHDRFAELVHEKNNSI